MPLSYILAISCLLTLVVMTVLVVTILVVMRFGQEWVSNLVERFTNPDKNKSKDESNRRGQAAAAPQQPQVASSQSLRQRAQSLDFPAPASGFSSQTAPQGNYQQENYGQQQQTSGYQQPARASLRARDQYPSFNPQAQQPSQQQGLQATMPSLSASRPFQGGQPQPPQQPQQGGFQQQGFQQQGLPPVQPQYPQQPQQGGLQPLRPQQGGYPQQQGGFQQQGLPPAQPQYPQQPQQGGLQPLRPQQGGYPQQQGGFQQQGLPPAPPQQGFQQQGQQPQQGGLGDYRPQLNSLPRPDERTQSARSLRRDNRRQDDFADDANGIEGLVDGATDFLDNF